MSSIFSVVENNFLQVGKLTRARRSVGDYELTNIDGENNSGANIK